MIPLLSVLTVGLVYAVPIESYGFDSGNDQATCGRQFRSGRMYKPPCDIGNDGYCTSAGQTYPWHAVKRFIRENQGLMRRMYGDQNHRQVLSAELYEDNQDEAERKFYAKRRNFDDINNEVNEARYLREDDDVKRNDDVLNTKFVYSNKPTISVKLADLKPAPHFRSTTSTTTEKTTETTIIPTTTDATTDETTDQTNRESEQNTTVPNEKLSAVLFQDMDENKNKIPINYEMRGINACPVKEEVVAPFWANNTRGEILALLNMYPFEQYVHWEKCTHENRQMYCRDGCRCEQQYRLHRLLAYDPNNECRGIFSDWFRFPSCCVCKCYTITQTDFRVTSRSPRANNMITDDLPDWYLKKYKPNHSNGDHG